METYLNVQNNSSILLFLILFLPPILILYNVHLMTFCPHIQYIFTNVCFCNLMARVLFTKTYNRKWDVFTKGLKVLETARKCWSQRKPNWVLVCPYFYRVVLFCCCFPTITVGLSSRTSPSLARLNMYSLFTKHFSNFIV